MKTPLHPIHLGLGARMVDFGGWDMPVFYSSIVDEHLCVRRASGLFDISHMGEVFIEGPGASAFLNRVLTNDIRKLGIGDAQYSLMCREDGGTIDDLYVYRLAEAMYLLIINASRIEVDVPWLIEQGRLDPNAAAFVVQPASNEWAALALQGPRTIQFIERLFPGVAEAGAKVQSVLDLKKNQVGGWKFDGTLVWVARTGYTGEDGFEVVLPASFAEPFWKAAMAAGHAGCLQPCGLGARDTLRTEMGYPLYGHELDETLTPIEAGLGFFVSMDKGEFIGRPRLLEQKTDGMSRKCVAFRVEGKAPPPRSGYRLFHDGTDVGPVVSGTLSPSLGCGIGMGYVPPGIAVPGTRIEVDIRGRRFPAIIERKPLYRPAVGS